MVLAMLLALVLRVNVPAAVLATFASNPLSWPAIWASSYLTGAWVLGHDPVQAAEGVSVSAAVLAQAAANPDPAVAFDAAATTLVPHVKPMLYGSLIVGLIAAVLSYYPTRRAVRRFQKRRRLPA